MSEQPTAELLRSNCIHTYFHCATCTPLKPNNVSLAEWSKTQAGFTAHGIQVWCNRCNDNVVHMGPQKQGLLTRYDAHPEHPLYRVPQEVLDVARACIQKAATTNDVDSEMADPIADSVVAALAERDMLTWPGKGSC